MAKRNIVIDHLKKHRAVYLQVGLMTGYLILVNVSPVLGANTDVPVNVDIGTKADDLYKKVMRLGRAVILIKGAIDTVQNALAGDFQACKKTILSYLGIYALLLFLPWGLDEVESLIGGLK